MKKTTFNIRSTVINDEVYIDLVDLINCLHATNLPKESTQYLYKILEMNKKEIKKP